MNKIINEYYLEGDSNKVKETLFYKSDEDTGNLSFIGYWEKEGEDRKLYGGFTKMTSISELGMYETLEGFLKAASEFLESWAVEHFKDLAKEHLGYTDE